MRRQFSTPVAVSALALCIVLPLTGCGKSKAANATATDTVAAAPGQPGLPATTAATSPAAALQQPADPCPSIGTVAETHGGAIALNGLKMVRLIGVCSPGELTAHLRNYGAGARYVLVADDLRAGVQPGALFELRLGPPSTGEAAVLGTLNFYAANRPGSAGQPHSISYDVTSQIASMAVAGWPSQGLGVAIAPSVEVTPGSDATIGALRLVAQAPR